MLQTRGGRRNRPGTWPRTGDSVRSTRAGCAPFEIAAAWPRLVWLLLACLYGGLALARGDAAPTAGAADVTSIDENYRLNPGDEINVQVYGEAELSKPYAIGPTGTISFPFLGEVVVTGKTSREIGQQLGDALRGTYLIDPKVTVTVQRYLPIYLNGQVKSPGAQSYQPGLTVRKAISLAGGLTERASTRRIYLIPASQPDGTKPRKVKLDQPVRPGDTITVEESFF